MVQALWHVFQITHNLLFCNNGEKSFFDKAVAQVVPPPSKEGHLTFTVYINGVSSF